MKLAMLYVLIFPLSSSGSPRVAAVIAPGHVLAQQRGPARPVRDPLRVHQRRRNNGSAFAGPQRQHALLEHQRSGWRCSSGRFLMIIPVLAIAGSMVGKKVVPPGPGTFPTNGALFAGLLVGVVLIVGALTFFPALSLGPSSSTSSPAAGKVF